MPTPLIADSFLGLLEKSGLLSSRQVADAVTRLKLRDLPGPKDIARALVEDGVLTRFQAERLLEGRYRGFFIDRYKILEILGAGGMACLYLAEDMHTRERLALKVLSETNKNDAGMVTRLKLEARAGKQLRHSSIIRTYDIYRTDDVFGEVLYLVMEFVEGINLEEMINLHGAIPWPQACDFVWQAAAGLANAHAAGMIHRDVKPGNLLVDHAGTIKLLDFGLALMETAEDADEFSLAMIFGHSCLGTADYISPEQSLDSYVVDARTDIYSLGCTMYVALTGKLPYPISSSCKKIEGHRLHAAPSLRDLVADVPEPVAAIVEKMMAKRPEDRFQTMTEVIEALAPFAQRMPVAFDFGKVLAWRAKDARRRFASRRRSTGGSSAVAVPTAKPILPSASTRHLSQATETAVERRSPGEKSVISLVAPFASARDESSLSRPELLADNSVPGPVLVPLDDGVPIVLVGDRIVLGRDTSCDVRLLSPRVSSRHCELRLANGHWQVRDLDSKNGIAVNGVRVNDNQVLQPGDRLSIADDHEYRIEYEPVRSLAAGWSMHWVVWGVLAVTAILTGSYLWKLFAG